MAKVKIVVNGKEVDPKAFSEELNKTPWPFDGSQTKGPMVSLTYQSGRPLVSKTLSCHPAQAEEMNRAAQEKGLTGVYYNERGECELTSRGAQGRAGEMKRRGVVDFDGVYSDHTRTEEE